MGNKCPADKAKEHVPRHYPSESSTHTSVRVDSEQDFLVNTPINRYGADGHKVKDSDTETVSSSATADETEAPKPGDPVNKECSFLGELYGIAIGALELELGSISQAVIILLEAYALGHVGEKALASFALSRIFVALMAVPPMYGIYGALETLCSQTKYMTGGSKKSLLYFYRGTFMYTICMVVCGFLWLNSRRLMAHLTDDEVVIEYALKYLLYYIPTFYLIGVSNFMRAYLCCNGDFKSAPIINIVGMVIMAISVQYLVISENTGIGFLGVLLSQLISRLGILLVSVVRMNTISGGMFSYSLMKNALNGWKEVFTLGIQGVYAIFIAAGTSQIVSILCIHFGEMALAAQAVLVSVDRMVLVFTTGISTVFTAKLGNYLGAGSIKGAKTVFHASLLIIALIAAPMFYVLYTKADFWVAIYTQNKELLSMILSMKLAFSIAVSFEICAVCLVGILKAQGRQKVVTKVMFLAFYTFAIPLGIMLSYYYEMGLHGLWIGVASGFTLSALSYTVDLLNTDWKKQVDLCRLYLV